MMLKIKKFTDRLKQLGNKISKLIDLTKHVSLLKKL